MKVSKWTRKDGTKVVKLVYQNGYSCYFIYNEAGRLLTFRDSTGYSPGRLVTFSDSTGYSEEYTYDEFGRLLTFSDSTGYSEEYTYDEFGRVITYKDSNGYSGEYPSDKKKHKRRFK